jgi:ion channel-forming bestrophin family protein
MALLLANAATPALALVSSSRVRYLQPSHTGAKSFLRTGMIAMETPMSFDEYMKSRNAGANGANPEPTPPRKTPRPPVQITTPPPVSEDALLAEKAMEDKLAILEDKIALLQFFERVGAKKPEPLRPPSDTDSGYKRVPWWEQTSSYSETQRKDRRTIFMHDDWVRHRSSERFLRNLKTLGSSGINQALSKELAFVTAAAVFVVVFNMLFVGYEDLSGISHVGPLNFLDADIKTLSLPALPFSIAMPALSLLLVFRTNTAYSRWNEARTLWGGLINNCRNVVRQTNTFFPDDARHNILKRRMAADTAAFCKSLRNFLRGPSDDGMLRGEPYELVDAGVMTRAQADDTMRAGNRAMFCLSAMSATLRKADIDPMHSARIDQTISTLVDLTGANERIFKSPIPLVYTRLLSRFLSFFLLLLPLALWPQLSESWNHWATIPAELLISFFLFGIEEVGIQVEEPFSVLPLESFCNGAIGATSEEMLSAVDSGVFDESL